MERFELYEYYHMFSPHGNLNKLYAYNLIRQKNPDWDCDQVQNLLNLIEDIGQYKLQYGNHKLEQIYARTGRWEDIQSRNFAARKQKLNDNISRLIKELKEQEKELEELNGQ